MTVGNRTILGRDSQGRLVDVPVEGDSGMVPTNGTAGGGGPHDHDGTYSPTGHTHAGVAHPDLAAHTDLGLAADNHDHDGDYADPHGHPYAADNHNHDGTYAAGVHAHEAAVHNHDGTYAGVAHAHPISLTDQDIPSGIARDAEVTTAIATHAATPHGGQSSEAYPVGSVFLAVVSTNPATLLGYGTWSALGAGRVLVGVDAGQQGEDTGGSATHSHAGHADHGALTHSGATVGNHSVTQPTAGNESAHTHGYTQVVNHVHVENAQGGTTGNNSGTHLMTSTATGGSLRQSAQSTQNPTGGVASGTTAGGSAHTHTLSGAAVDAHTVGQANQHAAQSHSAHDTASNLPPWLAVYIWKRTA